MIKITFLGTSAGIPTFTRSHPSISIEYFGDDYKLFLFDCGECTQMKLMRIGISFMKIDSIFITHWHADHFAGLISLIQTMNIEKRKNDLKIFAPDASEYVKKILGLYVYKPLFKVIPIDIEVTRDPIKIYEDKNLEISAIGVTHTIKTVAYSLREKDKYSINDEKLLTLGLKKGKWLRFLKERGYFQFNDGKIIKIEDVSEFRKGVKITYSGDCSYDENLIKLASNSKILIHEATYLEEDKDLERLHSSSKDAAKIAKLSNVELLVLTHLSRRYQSEEDIIKFLTDAKSIFLNTIVAEDFMCIEVIRNKIKIYRAL